MNAPLSQHPPTKPASALQSATQTMVQRLSQLELPVPYPAFPTPGHHEGFADVIRGALEIYNEWLATVGSEVRDNAVTAIDANLFCGTLQAPDEIDACERQAEALREYAEERRAMRRGSSW